MEDDGGSAVRVAKLRRRGPDFRERLDEARLKAAALVPLPPALWRQWVSDAASKIEDIAAANEEGGGGGGDEEQARQVAFAVCEQALADYQDVPIWKAFLTIATHTDPVDLTQPEDNDEEEEEEEEEEDEEVGEEEEETRRELFERAITAMGTHGVLGAELWAMYRAFERRKWNAALQKNPQGPLGPEAKAAGERVVKIYRRQLAVPMRGNDRTLEAMKRFVAMVASKCPGTSETKQEWDEMQGAEKLHEKVWTVHVPF